MLLCIRATLFGVVRTRLVVNSMNLLLGPAKKAILIGTDGASMELWQRMAAWGSTPNMAKLFANGIVHEVVEVPNWYLKP